MYAKNEKKKLEGWSFNNFKQLVEYVTRLTNNFKIIGLGNAEDYSDTTILDEDVPKFVELFRGNNVTQSLRIDVPLTKAFAEGVAQIITFNSIKEISITLRTPEAINTLSHILNAITTNTSLKSLIIKDFNLYDSILSNWIDHLKTAKDLEVSYIRGNDIDAETELSGAAACDHDQL